MASWRLGFVLIGVALILGTSQGLAFQPTDDAKVFEVSLRETPPLMASNDLTAAKDMNQALSDRLGGTWHVYMWSTLADTPEWVYGSGVELASQGLTNDAAAKEVATRFVASNGDLLRADTAELEVAQVVRGMGKVGVHFAQRYHGVPVIGGRVSAIFGETGRLYVFGSSFFRNIAVNSTPALTGAAAEARARADLPFNPATDRTITSPELAVLPVPGAEGGVDYHLVWRVTVGTSEPYGAWVTDVDAHTGAIVQRVNDVHSVYSGSSTGTVDPGAGYCANNPQTFPLSDMAVTVSGVGTVNTDASGNFSIAGTGGDRTVTAAFDGPLVDVNDVQFPPAAFSGTIQENVPFNINWTDATALAAAGARRVLLDQQDECFRQVGRPDLDHPEAHDQRERQLDLQRQLDHLAHELLPGRWRLRQHRDHRRRHGARVRPRDPALAPRPAGVPGPRRRERRHHRDLHDRRLGDRARVLPERLHAGDPRLREYAGLPHPRGWGGSP